MNDVLKRSVPRTRRAKLAPTIVRFRVREYYDRRRSKLRSAVPKIRDIDSRNDEVDLKKPWIYVFTVESWGVRLRYEAQIEGEDDYRLVNWKEKPWIKQNVRPTSKSVDEFKLRGVVHSSHDLGIYVMLSRIQIPRVRIEQYVGNRDVNPGAANLIRRRCTKFKPEVGRNVDFKQEHWMLYLSDPILLADRIKASFNKTLLDLQKHKEKNALEYQLAGSALAVLPAIEKEDEDFVNPGSGDGSRPKFDKNAAKRIVEAYNRTEKRLALRREAFGRELERFTSTAEYDEAMRDHDGEDVLEEERIRIEARHATGKMQSEATRKQMEAQLSDPSSRIYEYLNKEALFNSARKFTNLVAEFGDILGEYGNIIVKINKTTEVMAFLKRTVKFRIDFNIATYIEKTTVGVSVIETYRINVKTLATAPDFKGRVANHASRFLVFFEVINFAMAFDAFHRGRRDRKITDYAGPIGSLMDLAGAIGGRALIALEKAEREVAAAAGHATYQNSRKLMIWGRVMAVIGVIGGVMDMIEARSGALQSAQKLNYEQVIGFTVMFMGAAVGVHATVAAAAGASGPPGWIAIAIVIIGIVIVAYFSESPIEGWFRNSIWGDRPMFSRGKEGFIKQLEELNRILATFRAELRYVRPRLRLGFWNFDGFEVKIQPGFATAKSKYKVVTKGWVKREMYNYGLDMLDARTVRPTMDAKGHVQPIVFRVNKRFHKRVRIDVQLDLHGDGKFLVPAKGNAFWFFFFNESARDKEKAAISNSEFPD